MTKEELTLLNIGDDLDTLMNLDPRGYGVCRILYDGARRFTGEPLSVHGAKGLIKNIKKGEKVFILTRRRFRRGAFSPTASPAPS